MKRGKVDDGTHCQGGNGACIDGMCILLGDEPVITTAPGTTSKSGTTQGPTNQPTTTPQATTTAAATTLPTTTAAPTTTQPPTTTEPPTTPPTTIPPTGTWAHIVHNIYQGTEYYLLAEGPLKQKCVRVFSTRLREKFNRGRHPGKFPVKTIVKTGGRTS